jgi:hypothetical protein
VAAGRRFVKGESRLPGVDRQSKLLRCEIGKALHWTRAVDDHLMLPGCSLGTEQIWVSVGLRLV